MQANSPLAVAASNPVPSHPGDALPPMQGSPSFEEGSPAVPAEQERPASDAAGEHPLAQAVRLGRFVAAERELQKLLEAGKTVDEVCTIAGVTKQDVERTRRIVDKYNQSLELLNMQFSDLKVRERNEAMKLEWGLHIEGSTVRAMLTVERDLDLVNSVAAFKEKDLDVGIKENIVSVDSLGDPTTNENVWRCKTYNKTIGARGDDIIVECSCDALDEPLGSIWMCGASPPKEAKAGAKGKSFIKAATKALTRIGTKAVAAKESKYPTSWNGIELPPPDDGHNRAEAVLFAMKLTPLGSAAGGRRQGFRQTSVVQMQLTPAMVKIVSLVPGFFLKTLSRSTLEKNVKEFEGKVNKHPLLAGRVASSPRASFYEHVRRHLAGEAPLPAAKPLERSDSVENPVLTPDVTAIAAPAGPVAEVASSPEAVPPLRATGAKRRATRLATIGGRSLSQAF